MEAARLLSVGFVDLDSENLEFHISTNDQSSGGKTSGSI
jgi:hypothetical protein